jgi:hypothetical protein
VPSVIILDSLGGKRMNAFSKCANAECKEAFQAGHGKFFRFLQDSRGEASNAHGVCHYWLCDRCSQALTLKYQPGVGIFVVSRLHLSASARRVAA